jgi:N-succinyldiaminopimelate aminotransferase
MNPRLALLHPYPFQRLSALIQDIQPTSDDNLIRLSVGEPRHAPPKAALEALHQHINEMGMYPSTKGGLELRQAVSDWLASRFGVDTDPEKHILPVSGTREALFSFCQACVDQSSKTKPIVMMPNPFYQIYEGAALLAGAEPYYLNNTEDSGYKIDFEAVPKEIWQRTQLIYVCSPGNPAGAVMQQRDYEQLLALADEHDFIVAADECYSEIYFDDDKPPVGLLQVARAMGRKDYERCVVFHSLSKRSNLPGLRSGFVAGNADIMAQYLKYRTYHGATLSPPAQWASVQAWSDEAHVVENRKAYQEKFSAVLDMLQPVLPVKSPEAGFYLWFQVPMSGEDFTKRLYEQENVLVLPGDYLSRESGGINPGDGYIRLALVDTVEQCTEAAQRLRNFIETL